MTPRLSIVIPAYNEAHTIASVVERVLQLGQQLQAEVVVVDDGSTDGTSEAVAPFGEKIRLERLPNNHGKGAALKRGVQLARGEWVVFLDADGENNPADIVRMIEAVGGADSVVGSRLLHIRTRQAGTSPLFFWGGKFLTWWVNLLFGLSLTDVSSGMRLIRKDAFLSLPLCSDRFSIEAELTARHALAGHTIVEVPITYTPRAEKNNKKLRLTDGIRAVLFVLSIRLGS